MINDIPLTEENFCSVGKPKLAPEWPKVGDKVRFKGADGFHYPNFVNIIKFAKDNLKVGEIYTVRNCEVYSSWCAVWVEGKGLSDALFHLSMFEWPLKDVLIEEDNAPDTYVKESNVSGLGLFASRSFKTGEVIFDYNNFEKSWYKIKFEDLTESQINKNWYIPLDDESCLTNDKYSKFSYINHSRNPNCKWLIREKLILADRDIQKDEELFIDYRLEERPNRKEYPSWI